VAGLEASQKRVKRPSKKHSASEVAPETIIAVNFHSFFTRNAGFPRRLPTMLWKKGRIEMNWSRWFRCESSFGLLLVPNQPGIFALAEEVMQPAEPHVRRMLAVFQVEEADDLSRAMSRLYAAGSPWRAKLAQTNCFVRYAITPSLADRQSAAAALKSWLNAQREVASQVFELKTFESKTFEKPVSMAAEQKAITKEMGEVRNERRAARAEQEGEAAERCGVLEKETELKTMAERAVDRVTQGLRLSKGFPVEI
jgi:hypothetical protein